MVEKSEIDLGQIDERCVIIAFDAAEKLQAQSVSFDFLFDGSNNPLLVEISYGFPVTWYGKFDGYWTSDMLWHAGSDFDFCGWVVENLIK